MSSYLIDWWIHNPVDLWGGGIQCVLIETGFLRTWFGRLVLGLFLSAMEVGHCSMNMLFTTVCFTILRPKSKVGGGGPYGCSGGTYTFLVTNISIGLETLNKDTMPGAEMVEPLPSRHEALSLINITAPNNPIVEWSNPALKFLKPWSKANLTLNYFLGCYVTATRNCPSFVSYCCIDKRPWQKQLEKKAFILAHNSRFHEIIVSHISKSLR